MRALFEGCLCAFSGQNWGFDPLLRSLSSPVLSPWAENLHQPQARSASAQASGASPGSTGKDTVGPGSPAGLWSVREVTGPRFLRRWDRRAAPRAFPAALTSSLLTRSLVFVGCKAQGAGIACDDTLQLPGRITRVYCPLGTAGAPLIYFQAGLGVLLQWEPRGGGGWPGPDRAPCEPFVMWLGTVGYNERHMVRQG